MSQNEFLKLILASPTESLNKTVYADWLEENGNTKEATAWRVLADKWPFLPSPTASFHVWLSESRGNGESQHLLPLGKAAAKEFLSAEDAWNFAVATMIQTERRA